MKYPKESLPKKPTKNIADKKYGFFQTDKDFFQDVAAELGLMPGIRPPLLPGPAQRRELSA
jgi:dGTPase